MKLKIKYRNGRTKLFDREPDEVQNRIEKEFHKMQHSELNWIEFEVEKE